MICLTGHSSHLKCSLFPPFDLSSSNEWEMGFLDLMTYNTIPNIEENVNNILHLESGHEIKIPTGSYEITDISNYLYKELQLHKADSKFILGANSNTMKSEIFCSEAIDFTKQYSLAPLLGFTNKSKLEANKWYKSPNPVSIVKVDVIRITCNIVRGSYRDGVEGHVLHEFYPTVGSGYKIVEKPSVVKYLPISKNNTLDEFYIRLEDQNGDLVNFRGESINIRVDVRKRLK